MRTDTITLSPKVTSIADDLRLTPQARKVLSHLERGKGLSQMEALTVYSIFRLASRINELRDAGYEITSEIKQDEADRKSVV